MNRLSAAERAKAINCLIEGCSLRSTVHLTGVAKKTVARILVEAGDACAAYHDKVMRNLTDRRFTRLTNAFPGKVEDHRHMIAIYTMNYSFCRIHQTLRATPAMEAGLSDLV